MNQARHHSPALLIPTRDMIFALILAQLVAVIGGSILASRYPDFEQLIVTAATTTSMVIFVALVMLGGKQPIGAVIAATAPPTRPAGNVLWWTILAILAGLAMRFGTSGFVLAALQVVNPASITAELNELAAVRNDTTMPLNALTVVLILIDATNEEIVYRRILQTYFTGKFGLAAGVIGVAVVFGAVHGSVTIMLAGIWLGLLYLYSGRLWVVALAHAAANLAVYAAAAMQQPGTQGLFFIACYAAAGLMLLAMIWTVRTVRRPPWRRA